MAGRPCSPRLLFVFEGCRVPQPVEDSAAASKSHRQVNLLLRSVYVSWSNEVAAYLEVIENFVSQGMG